MPRGIRFASLIEVVSLQSPPVTAKLILFKRHTGPWTFDKPSVRFQTNRRTDSLSIPRLPENGALGAGWTDLIVMGTSRTYQTPAPFVNLSARIKRATVIRLNHRRKIRQGSRLLLKRVR